MKDLLTNVHSGVEKSKEKQTSDISMDLLQPGASDRPSSSTTSSRMVTPSTSMELEEARRKLQETEQRQRILLELESRIQQLRDMFVHSEQEVVEHKENVQRVTNSILQGELYISEKGQSLKKVLKYKKHRPSMAISSMLGLGSCLPWPVKLK